VTPPLDRFEWERLIRELPFPLAVKCTAYALATYVNGDGSNAWPGIGRLVRATGSSRSTVIRSLSALEGQGFIRAVARGGGKATDKGRSTVYELSVPVDNPARRVPA
jgi:hypothetical protein